MVVTYFPKYGTSMVILEKHWRGNGFVFEASIPYLSSLIIACGQPRIAQRRQKITVINQVLHMIIRLRKYVHVETLSLWFDIDRSSVVGIFNKVLPELWRYFQNQIGWPYLHEWRNLMRKLGRIS